MKQFKLTIPAEIKDWLAERAARNLRSQSAEIILALRDKMEHDSDRRFDGDQASQR
jgi:hypothetical protein